MSRILVISLSDLARDPRVDRQLSALGSSHTVIAAGLGPPAEQGVQFVDLRVAGRPVAAELKRRAESLALLTTRRHAERVFWRDPQNSIAKERLSAVRADVIIANDLSALPLACAVAGSARIVFDAHELAVAEHADQLWWRVLMVPYVDGLLRAHLPRVAVMTTVSAGIAEIYRARYGVDPIVLTNAPERAQLEPSETGSRIRMIHHGAPFRERRLGLMIDAVELLDDRFELDLMLVPGHSRYDASIRRQAAKSPRVRIVDPVPQRTVVRACNRYDVGIAFFPPTTDNLRHVLPNKLFEFIQARLAVAIGPSQEMVRVVEQYGCGVVASDFTPAALAGVLNALTPERLSQLKARAGIAASELNAGRNASILLGLVDKALGR